MSLTYTRIQAADTEVLLTLEKHIFAEDAWPKEDFELFLSRPTTFGYIAALDGVPAGYVLCQKIADEAEVLSIGLLPAYQGQGHGKAVLGYTLQALAELRVKKLFLEVRRSNGAAIALYQSFGAVPMGVRKGYYEPSQTHPEREDALTYKIPIHVQGD